VIDVAALLAAHDEVRGRMPELPGNVEAERDGPLIRTLGWQRGFVEYRDLGGLEGAALDDLISRQVRFFGERRESFEWKLHGHDQPADLADRLRAAGFVADPEETVLVAPVDRVATAVGQPRGVTVREAADEADFAAITRMEERVWGEELSWMGAMLSERRAASPESFVVVLAEAGGEVVCAAWVRWAARSPFATLHGGATLPAWRRRGIYRALVAWRATRAAASGRPYLRVDASADSRPILERLGFVPITTTTPYIWTPPDEIGV
jgi:GNAT superfamily N-acetyltransferase